MNVTENGSKDSCDITKNIPKDTTISSVPEHNFKVPLIYSKMPENNLPPESKVCHDMPIKNDKIITKNMENQGLLVNSIDKPCHSNDYLFGLCNQDVNVEHNSNHKFYGCKRREYPSHCCESFGLPDDPIFSNSMFLDRIQKSPLDADLADPWDICVVNLDYIDQPWLIENQEVITPYCDVESLFPFEIEDIRQKTEPENINLLNENGMFNELVDSSVDNNKEKNNIFTSTPLKNQDGNPGDGVSISTINIVKTADTVDISVLKDQVIKALEEVIKKKNGTVTNGMKIQIVTGLSRSQETLPQKSSVEVRINESTEIESCQSSFSSKENYFVGITEITKDKVKKLNNSKKSNSIMLSVLNKDWQDIQETNLIAHQNELLDKTDKFDLAVDNSISEKKNKSRKKEHSIPAIRRNLRSSKANHSELESSELSNKVTSGENSTKRILRSSLEGIDDFNNSSMDKSISNPLKTGKLKNQGIEREAEDTINKPVELRFARGNQGSSFHSKNDKYKEIISNTTLLATIDDKYLQAASNINVSKINKKQKQEEKMLKNILPSHNFKKISEHDFSTKNYFNHKNDITTITEKRITRRSLRNEMFQSNHHNGSGTNNSLDNSIEDLLNAQYNEDNFQGIVKNFVAKENLTRKDDITPDNSIDRRVTRSFRNELSQLSENESDFYTSDDKSALTRDEKPKRRTKHIVPERLQFDQNKHDGVLLKRILRSSNQGLKENLNEMKYRRRRTLSSTNEKNMKEIPKIEPSRKRSVSANFDSETETMEFSESVSLHSQSTETKSAGKFSLMKYSTKKNSKLDNIIIKSPKISFNLSTSSNDSPRNLHTTIQVKGILKNVSNGDLNFANKPHLGKQMTMNMSSCSNTFHDLPKLSRQDRPEEDLDDKKNKDKSFEENGTGSRIKLVISPLEIKGENGDNETSNDCPILPLGLPITKRLTRTNNIPKQVLNEITTKTRRDCHQNYDDVDKITMSSNSVQLKEIKKEEIVYNLGDFVWAQVAKYPYWPAVICNDPDTETFYNEVQMKNRPLQKMYHMRFFGDSGKRAWVKRIHIMLYSSSKDLEMIAMKLKSESKNYNVIRPYLVIGSQQTVEKWNKANEEIVRLKNKPYEEVINYLLKCYESYVNKRREKRKLNMIDASSESESEEPERSEKHRRKRWKSSHEQHVTSEDNTHSLGFDEINISVQTKNNKIEINDSNCEKRPRKSVKYEILEVSPKHLDKSLADFPTLEISAIDRMSNDNLNIAEKVTPRRSGRSLKGGDKINILDHQRKSLELETGLVKVAGNSSDCATLASPSKNEDSGNLLFSETRENIKENDGVESVAHLSKKQTDETSEVGSKISSDFSSSNPNMYSYEYQLELHKKNSLFNGFRNVKVCDYCMKQGDLYKCKGRCGGFFHLECASKVAQPRSERRPRKSERSPNKVNSRILENAVNSTPKAKRSEECCKTRSQSQCQIVTIRSRHIIDTPKKDNFPANFYEMSIAEQIDYGMKEMMSKFENRTVYHDLTDSGSEEGFSNPANNRKSGIMESPSSIHTLGSENKHSDLEEIMEEEKSSDDLEVSLISEQASNNSIKHVTADSVILTERESPIDITNLKCTYCRVENSPPCFSCGLEIPIRGSSARQKCSQLRCGRYYHPHCLKMYPQTQWSIGKWSKTQQPEDSFTCPAHTCHTCFSEELGSSAACRLPGDKLARCLLCPAAFHTTTFCIPAGSEILGGSQIVCPRHRSKPIQPINTVWCFICSEGGNLVCCDACPTSVHPECQPINFTDDDKYICEDCESGRFPLYDEVVWVKLGKYRWWPAIVLFPNEVPENVRALKHQRGDFVVRFFGTHDHYWVNKSRSFLFQEGDRGGSPGEPNRSKNKVYESFGKAIEDAAIAYKCKKEFKLRREAECINSLKPPPYTKINKNRPVGNVKCIELNLSNATACECDPNKPHPCGPDSNCINRLLMTECDPDVCPATIRCRNQAFQKREYPPLVPYKTQGRGWGLKTLAPIKTGQFLIEYVGELIDSEEYQRRIRKMHEKKEENYYFMTVDSDRMIDAGPKGNLSRFMNHSCNPNCVTQKWTVKGDTRVGLFANCDIDTGSELTFNYNLEVVGQEKKVCKCGATNCSGYIGVKAKLDKADKSGADSLSAPSEHRRSRKYTKKRPATPPLIPPCFMCGRKKSDITCNNKFCNKGYHLRCLKLVEMPDVLKYACPRHNCNICSNRTIRCCVKCTNSFCPSHSEGNVRHDKFLGFVCRLHDPGISSAEGPSEPIKDVTKHKRNRSSLSICDAQKQVGKVSTTNREAVRTRCRKHKEKKMLKKFDPVVPPTQTANVGSLQEKVLTLSATTSKRFNGCKIPKRKPTLPLALEALRVQWRINSKKIRLENEAEQLKSRKRSEVKVEVRHGHVNKADIVSKNDVTLIHDIGLVAQEYSVNINEVVNENSRVVVTSKPNIDTQDIVEVTPSSSAERPARETLKTSKRLRPKLSCTDESAVSSTTSDESATSKESYSKKTRRPEHGPTSDADKDNQVSSSPIKYTQQTSPDISEDELSLSARLKRRSIVRKPRKKNRCNVNRLSSTAKLS